MGSYASLYFDNIQVDWEKNAAPSVCRILFRPLDFLQVPLRKLPPHLRAFYRRGRYFGPETQIYSVLTGSAVAAERRLSILGYSRSRAEEAWNSARTELVLQAEEEEDGPDEFRRAKKAIAYKEWQRKYTKILKDKATENEDKSAETFLFLGALNLTEMADDPLMWIAMRLYAFEPT